MSTSMRAYRYYGFGGPARIDEVPTPRPGALEVVVRVKACQIGGDVLKVLAGTGPVRGAADFQFPHTPGYRGAGVVEAVGTRVSAFEVGDRVVVNGFVNCGVCGYCLRGLDNLCESSRMIGIDSGMPGAMAELVKVPEWAVFALADGVSFAGATLLANMALSVHALERALARAPFTTAIFGCGLVGCATLAVAKAYGASEIIGIDTEPAALANARRYGATRTVNAREQNVVAALREATEGAGVDVAIEIVGVGETVQDAIRGTRPRGVTLLLGALGGISLSFPDYYRDVIQRETDIRPCFGKTQADFAKAVELAATGALDLSPYPLREYPLDAVEQAIAQAAAQRNGDLHVIEMEP
jgi:threonine dehydrogenase-like Zn-dependent dehydrogenase